MRNSNQGTVLLVAVAAVSWLAGPCRAQTTAEELRLTVGKSVVIDNPSDVRQISTSAPEVVDASPVTTREILLHAKGLGTSTVIIWSKNGQRTFYTVTVDVNVDPLRRLLKETFPTEDIQAQSSRDSVSLTGRVSSAQVAERAAAMAAAFGKTVVNNLSLAAPVERQVLLRVKFAELDRTRAMQFGINLVSAGAANTISRVTTGQFTPPTLSSLSPGGSTTVTTGNTTATTSGSASAASLFNVSEALNIFMFRPDLNLGAFIKALQSESILQIMAEPNLITTSGKEATFLVGGEFPIPVLQGGSNSGAVTIQFREFGIRLLFVPYVTDNGTIKVHLRHEVSTIDVANAVSFNGFLIPALATRKAETDVELGERQSFVVAGLIDNREQESISKIPGLSSLPILGELFKSRDVKKNRSELVMIVTPEITQPLKPGEAQPTPYFPRDFLKRIEPPVQKSDAAVKSDAKVEEAGKSESAASGRSWLKPWTAFRKAQ